MASVGSCFRYLETETFCYVLRVYFFRINRGPIKTQIPEAQLDDIGWGYVVFVNSVDLNFSGVNNTLLTGSMFHSNPDNSPVKNNFSKNFRSSGDI